MLALAEAVELRSMSFGEGLVDFLAPFLTVFALVGAGQTQDTGRPDINKGESL